MTTISVPVSGNSEIALNNLMKSGYGSNKADVFRRAVIKASEDEAVEAVLRAEKEISLGKGMTGDLRELAKLLK